MAEGHMYTDTGISPRCTATYGDVKCWREAGHRRAHHGPPVAGSLESTWWSEGEVPVEAQQEKGFVDATGQLQRSFIADMSNRPGAGTAAAVVQAVEQVKPCGIRLVCVVLQGPAPQRWWRWAEPVALWLLKRAGYEVCQ